MTFSSAFKMKNKCHIGNKTLWEKEKLLCTSNFSFFHNVFHSCMSLVRQNASLCGNELIATFQLSSAASLNLGRSQKSFWEWVKCPWYMTDCQTVIQFCRFMNVLVKSSHFLYDDTVAHWSTSSQEIAEITIYPQGPNRNSLADPCLVFWKLRMF